MHGSHMIGAGERLHGAIGELEEEMAFFIQIEHAAENLAMRGLGADLTMEEPASLADLSDGGAEVVIEALKLGVKAFEQAFGERVAINFAQNGRGELLQQRGGAELRGKSSVLTFKPMPRTKTRPSRVETVSASKPLVLRSPR